MTQTWPQETQVLVVDDDDLFRESVVMQLQQASGVCYGARSYDEAVQVLRDRREIGVVLLDHLATSANIDKVVRELRAQRPGVLIIGNSGADRRADFAAAGVTRYLDKPWHIEQLARMVNERIDTCCECGLPLPLRRPREEEAASSWECAFCGSRYAAVLDEDAPTDVRPNASSV